MAAAAAATSSSHLLVSGCTSRSAVLLSPSLLRRRQRALSCQSQYSTTVGRGAAVRCSAVETTAPAAETTKKKKSSYEIQTLTGWLLKQEQSGTIDAELAIVLSSISMACKQIASLVQRAGISNLTGVQGAVNVQGEDQKKLDVVSNEVIS